MFKFNSLSSWGGVIFLLLLLFSLWYFLLRSERSDGTVLLPQIPCSKSDKQEKDRVNNWWLLYYQAGCQAVASDVPRAAASWLTADNELISSQFALPPLPKESAVLLSPDYTWDTYSATTSAPAIKTLGSVSSLSRLYLDSALIDIALKKEYPLLSQRKDLRRKISLSLALNLEHNAYSNKKAPITLSQEEILDLLDRCRNSACLAPLRSEK